MTRHCLDCVARVRDYARNFAGHRLASGLQSRQQASRQFGSICGKETNDESFYGQ
jgi:hypothetical protein